MAISDCNYCDLLQNCGARLDDRGWFQTLVLRILCNIGSIVDEWSDSGVPVVSATTEILYVPVVPVLGTTLTAAFVAAMTDAHDKLEIVVDNETNEAIEVSFDGAVVHEYLSPSSAVRLSCGAYGRHESGNVYLRHAGVVPTAGSVYVSARY